MTGRTIKKTIKDYFLRLSLHQKLVAMMMLLSVSLMSVFILLYSQTEKAMYDELENQTAELTKAIQVGVEEVTSSGTTDEKRLQNYLRKLNTRGVKELSIISNSDKIISSTNPKNVGKWLTTKKKDLIFKAQLGEPVTGEGHAYNVIIPVVAGAKHYGYIHLTVNTEDFSTFMRKRLLQRVVAAGIVFGAGIVFIFYLAKRYTKPIENVVEAARMVAGGDLNQDLNTDRKDEIGELTESFNFMVRKLREERELEERLRDAEHLAGIGQFSTSIAHEIRNPLNFISLSIDHIRERYRPVEGDREAFESLISNIKKEILRVSGFAESFLQYGRPLELNLQKTDVGVLIEDVISLVTAKAQKEGIDIRKEYEALPVMHIDSEFIKTCLYNIVLNAFQAMPDGGTLTVRTKKTKEKFSIIVEDTGIGISEEKAGKIFDPFFTTKGQGLGLGLALTKRIIEEHKGKVDFKSTEGKGSTVMIVLPLDREV
jgi:signal transduction histidine kinase